MNIILDIILSYNYNKVMKNEKLNNKMIAVYCRVSTFDQENGLKSQEKSLKDYCKNHGFTRLVWYKDKISGSTANRPAFNKL